MALGVPLIGAIDDAVVSASFRKIGGPPGGGFGLIVHDQAADSRDGTAQSGRFIVAEISDEGDIGIWRREEDRWVDLVPWTPSSAVHVGDVSNELTVQTHGDNIILLANGVQVAQTAMGLDKGGVGVFVGGDSNQVALQSLTVRTNTTGVRLRPTPVPPTATPLPPTPAAAQSTDTASANSRTAEQNLAIIQRGIYVAPNDPLVFEFATVLDSLASRCQESRTQLGGGAVRLVDDLRQQGVYTATPLSLLQGLDNAVPAELFGPDHLAKCSEYLGVLAYLISQGN